MSTILQRLPVRQYSKKEICLALSDPEKFIKGDIANIRLCWNAQRNLKRDILHCGLLQVFGITEEQYDQLKILRASWCELIFEKLM